VAADSFKAVNVIVETAFKAEASQLQPQTATCFATETKPSIAEGPIESTYTQGMARYPHQLLVQPLPQARALLDRQAFLPVG
jgi:hypothetical protein